MSSRGHESRDIEMTDLARVAARVIAEARAARGGTDAFDYSVCVDGIWASHGELHNQTYILANEHLPQVKPGISPEELEERRSRAADLWSALQPELEAYVQRCRAAKWSGWSRESGGPVRRVRDTDPPKTYPVAPIDADLGGWS